MASRVLPASRSILSAAQASPFVSLSHPTPTRRMRLTRELVLRAAATNGDPGTLTGPVEAGDYQAMSDALLAGRPTDGEVCVFAYGSLIWKPACTVVEQRVAPPVVGDRWPNTSTTRLSSSKRLASRIVSCGVGKISSPPEWRPRPFGPCETRRGVSGRSTFSPAPRPRDAADQAANTTSRSFASIWLPALTRTSATVPSRSARTAVSIFIASMESSASPALTA